MTVVFFIQSPSLLPLVLYFLPIVSSPSLKLTLLHSLPSLASHKFSVGPTVNVLLRLAGNASFLPLSLRLLGKLWIQHDSVFPHFVSLLAQHKVPAVVSTEFDIAKGIVIRDICCKRLALFPYFPSYKYDRSDCIICLFSKKAWLSSIQ